MDRYDYDAEIDRLVNLNSAELREAWDCSAIDDDNWMPNSPLFHYCNATGAQPEDEADTCGCLTLIRSYLDFTSADPALAEAIRSDKRIPDYVECLIDSWNGMSVVQRRAALQIFANWQRAMDATIRAGRPWHDDFIPRLEHETKSGAGDGARVHGGLIPSAHGS